uniref:Late embryogenesis abundant protein LEA-2 subgroup domain-containing protein n=1 Tax=Nelumbo nucifera TaxID=4432 RepID=A0A822ZFC6_NELNU|nr:TPA_asm: hypothetical protein HUJ06_001450 [Nelumbo nucifera]
MAEKDQVHPLAPASQRARSDEESTRNTLQAKEFRRKRNVKCFAYIAAFVVFQTIIILVFALTVLKIKTPSVKLSSVTVDNLSLNPNTTASTVSPSFSMTVVAQVAVKNKNFGHFKFDNSTAIISYRGVAVGEALIPRARAKARKTRRMDVTMEVTSQRMSDDALGLENLRTDIDSGFLSFTSYAKLSGKVHLIKIMKKRKTAEMKCSFMVNLRDKTIQNLSCE